MQTIYEVIGRTATIDYGSRSESISLALFLTTTGAENFIKKEKSRSQWRMEWNDFIIKERTLLP